MASLGANDPRVGAIELNPAPISGIFNQEKQRIVRSVLWHRQKSQVPPGSGKRLSAGWREIALSRIDDVDIALQCLKPEPTDPLDKSLVDKTLSRLKVARERVERPARFKPAWSGVDVEHVWANIHSAEVILIRLSDFDTVKAMVPNIIADARLLGPQDRLIARLDAFNKKQTLNDADRKSIAQCVTSIYRATTEQFMQTRSFRNILFSTTFVLTSLAVVVGILGALPLGADIWAPKTGLSLWLAELLGLLGASIVGSVVVRQMHGSSQPYAVPMASLLLKLPTGALTAAVGLMVLRAGFVDPLLGDAGTAKLVAAALALGASQQTFTRLIDDQAQNVLNAVPSLNAATRSAVV